MMKSITNINMTDIWNQQSRVCQRDLVIKKIAIFIIAMANLAAIATLFTYATLYLPLHTLPVLLTPFLIGVLGAMNFFKIPVCGLTHKDTNPLTFLSKALSVSFFFPLICFVRWLDLTNYGDPYKARAIIEDFKTKEFEEIMSSYGPKARNLGRYGLIQEDQAQAFKKLYLESKHTLAAMKFLTDEKVTQTARDFTKVKQDLGTHESSWARTKENIVQNFPNPEPRELDFSKASTRLRVWVRAHLGLSTL